jgi:hypothetical protein
MWKEMKTLIPVTDFIEFALSHANPKTVPIGAKLIAPAGTAGVWRYVYGMHGQVITQTYLDRAFKHYKKEVFGRYRFPLCFGTEKRGDGFSLNTSLEALEILTICITL